MGMDSFQMLRRFIMQEREIFGDAVIAAMPPARNAVPKDTDMPRQKSTGARDEDAPTLFGREGSKPGRGQEAWEDTRSLDEFRGMIHDCRKCGLWQTRTNLVFGVGNPKASFMVVGEAPGADEDAQGEPFVGKAGQLLNKILAAIGFAREDVYIANVLKSRPPNNRKPQADEVEACLPYLEKQVALIKPKLILCLGLTAAENLLKSGESMARLRGRVFHYQGIPLMVTYHPAALLRNPNWKHATWDDVRAARKLHDELVQGQKVP